LGCEDVAAEFMAGLDRRTRVGDVLVRQIVFKPAPRGKILDCVGIAAGLKNRIIVDINLVGICARADARSRVPRDAIVGDHVVIDEAIRADASVAV
jgi:hypothetical protein